MDVALDTPIHVLHVDDDPRFLDLIEHFIGAVDEELRVVSVDDPRDALARLRTDDRIECVVSDYEMPGMDGLEFLARVRSQCPTLPFILYTAHGDESIAADAISSGVDDYVTKDTGWAHYRTLSARIRREVRRAREEAEREARLAALDAVHEGVCIVDAEGDVTYANEAYLSIHGYDREDLLGESWETLSPDGAVPFVTTEVLPKVEADGGRTEAHPDDRVTGDLTRVESTTVSELPTGGLAIVVTAYDRSADE